MSILNVSGIQKIYTPRFGVKSRGTKKRFFCSRTGQICRYHG